MKKTLLSAILVSMLSGCASFIMQDEFSHEAILAVSSLSLSEEIRDTCKRSLSRLNDQMALLDVEDDRPQVLIVNAGGAYITLTTVHLTFNGSNSSVRVVDGSSVSENRLTTKLSEILQAKFSEAHFEYEARNGKTPPSMPLTHESCIVLVGFNDKGNYVDAYSAGELESIFPVTKLAISNAYAAVNQWPGEEDE